MTAHCTPDLIYLCKNLCRGATVIATFQKRKPRHKGAKQATQGHAATKWHRRDLNPDHLKPAPTLLTTLATLCSNLHKPTCKMEQHHKLWPLHSVVLRLEGDARVHTHTDTAMHTCTQVHTHVHIHTCTHAFMHIHTHRHRHVHSVCMCVCA